MKDIDITKDSTPVAADIVTRCTKCKLELRHTVLSHNKEGIVAKVKCCTCGGEHKYYSEQKRAAAKIKKEKAAIAAKKTREAEKYARLLEQNQGKKIIPYGMLQKYNDHDIIDHKTFGKGVVTTAYSQKIDVLFETGVRILACNRESQ